MPSKWKRCFHFSYRADEILGKTSPNAIGQDAHPIHCLLLLKHMQRMLIAIGYRLSKFVIGAMVSKYLVNVKLEAQMGIRLYVLLQALACFAS